MTIKKKAAAAPGALVARVAIFVGQVPFAAGQPVERVSDEDLASLVTARRVVPEAEYDGPPFVPAAEDDEAAAAKAAEEAAAAKAAEEAAAVAAAEAAAKAETEKSGK